MPTGVNGKYQAWGIGNGYKRPFKRNFCAAGNFSETVQGVWGWADADCSTPLIFICETKGGSAVASEQRLGWHGLPCF